MADGRKLVWPAVSGEADRQHRINASEACIYAGDLSAYDRQRDLLQLAERTTLSTPHRRLICASSTAAAAHCFPAQATWSEVTARSLPAGYNHSPAPGEHLSSLSKRPSSPGQPAARPAAPLSNPEPRSFQPWLLSWFAAAIGFSPCLSKQHMRGSTRWTSLRLLQPRNRPLPQAQRVQRCSGGGRLGSRQRLPGSTTGVSSPVALSRLSACCSSLAPRERQLPEHLFDRCSARTPVSP